MSPCGCTMNRDESAGLRRTFCSCTLLILRILRSYSWYLAGSTKNNVSIDAQHKFKHEKLSLYISKHISHSQKLAMSSTKAYCIQFFVQQVTGTNTTKMNRKFLKLFWLYFPCIA